MDLDRDRMAGKLKFRVDSRLIHGQVATRWLREWDIATIVIIDTSISRDDFLKEIYLMAAPPGIDVSILSPSEARRIQCGREGNILVLFKDVVHATETINAGLDVDELQIGCLPKRRGCEPVYKTVFLDDHERVMLHRLVQKGIKVFFQSLPDDEPYFYK